MVLRTLHLRSFRAHAETELTLTPGINLAYGPNGAGKTNLLEAIHYLCLSKSFVASQDRYALRVQCPYFEVRGELSGARRSKLSVRLVYVPDEGKRIFVNGAPLERLADIVGITPVVVFSPEDHALTAGGPDERRRFLDNALSQAQPAYLDDLIKYRRTLRQRNELLLQYRRAPATTQDAVLASWDAELVALGSRIVAARRRFLDVFNAFLEQAYRRIESVAEHPTITYETISGLDGEADATAVAEGYRRALARVARRERERGRTLVGPHRDELVFRLNEFEVRRYASQGQHRTFGMALKLAKYFYLQDRLDEPPVLLLDDVFDTLDPARTRVFLELLQSGVVGQSLITAAERAPFDRSIPFQQPEHQALHVVAGKVEPATAVAEPQR